MAIYPLPNQADKKSWQQIAQQQHALAIEHQAMAQEQQALILKQQALIEEKDTEIAAKEALIAQLTAEIARLRKLQFGVRAEAFTAEQRSVLDETIAEDIASITCQLEQALPSPPKSQPKRQALPPQLPREEIRYSPSCSVCPDCQGELHFIRDEVSEQLEYIPGQFIVKQHIRPIHSCRQCDKVITPSLPAQIIDKSIAGPGLLAQVAISKYADHLPLYRQQQIFARQGITLPMSTLAGWIGVIGVALEPLVKAMQTDLLKYSVLHADETPVKMLDPGQGKTKQAYSWLYRSSITASSPIAIYQFHESRKGQYAQAFLQAYQGALMVDDYNGYKALFEPPFSLTELGCWAHVRRKFFDLYSANKSAHAQTALAMIQALYQVERIAAELTPDERKTYRQQQAKPIITALHNWATEKLAQIPRSTGLARAIQYMLKRWPALIRYLDNGEYPVDNNHAENSIRPIALGRKNWLFAGSLSAGQRAANIMSLIETAKLNGHDPYAYLKSVLTKLPSWPNRLLHQLLPYHWQPDSG